MPITSDLSILTLIGEASLIVKAVMALLVLLSILSWYAIFTKISSLGKGERSIHDFENEFWRGSDLTTLYNNSADNLHQAGPMERMFVAGFREFAKLKARNVSGVGLADGARRAMKAVYQREIDRLEAHLSFLATVGSVSPYIGLFGTVWGIMNAFRGLANVSSATLAQVAPGIAEALVATAIGLFAAIPAVIAYNRFSHRIDRMSTRLESFSDEFSNILQRQSN